MNVFSYEEEKDSRTAPTFFNVPAIGDLDASRGRPRLTGYLIKVRFGPAPTSETVIESMQAFYKVGQPYIRCPDCLLRKVLRFRLSRDSSSFEKIR